MWIFLNDAFVREDQALISVFDHGFLYGDGVYETLRIYHGQAFLLSRHLDRLRESCRLIGLDFSMSDNKWAGILGESLRRNELHDASVRVTISRGKGPLGIDPSLCPRPTMVMVTQPFHPYPQELKKEGIHLELVGIRRNPMLAQSPRIKSLSFLNNILAKQEALRLGGRDALMLNMEGYISECPTSNIFFVKNGILKTPSVDCGILEGVTREVVMMLAKEQGFPTQEGRYGAQEFFNADECFITNTSMEIMPVRRVGEQSLGSGRPGPITMQLAKLFEENLNRFLCPLPPQ